MRDGLLPPPGGAGDTTGANLRGAFGAYVRATMDAVGTWFSEFGETGLDISAIHSNLKVWSHPNPGPYAAKPPAPAIFILWTGEALNRHLTTMFGHPGRADAAETLVDEIAQQQLETGQAQRERKPLPSKTLPRIARQWLNRVGLEEFDAVLTRHGSWPMNGHRFLCYSLNLTQIDKLPKWASPRGGRIRAWNDAPMALEWRYSLLRGTRHSRTNRHDFMKQVKG